ncbi:MAG: glycosyltransferase [Candidatus Bathyarchaeia archaeon]
MVQHATSPQVSFVLPAFNEGAIIEYSLERLDSLVNGNGFEYEIVVVDDGSIDDTRLKAVRYAGRNSHVHVVGYGSNEGKGFAIKTGFWMCKGKFVVFVDSDSDISYDVVLRYIEALKQADIAIGSKWHKDSVVDVSLMRKLFSFCFNRMVRLLTGLKVSDTQCGIKAVRREAFVEVFRHLCVKRYAFDVELLFLAKLYGLRIVELPVKLTLKSRFSFREVWHMFLDLLGIAYRLKVKRRYERGFV